MFKVLDCIHVLYSMYAEHAETKPSQILTSYKLFSSGKQQHNIFLQHGRLVTSREVRSKGWNWFSKSGNFGIFIALILLLLPSLRSSWELDSLEREGLSGTNHNSPIATYGIAFVCTNHRPRHFRWWRLERVARCFVNTLRTFMALWGIVFQLIGKYGVLFDVVKQESTFTREVTFPCYFCIWMVCLLRRMNVEICIKSKSVIYFLETIF
jgi:hypothetical protein